MACERWPLLEYFPRPIFVYPWLHPRKWKVLSTQRNTIKAGDVTVSWQRKESIQPFAYASVRTHTHNLPHHEHLSRRFPRLHLASCSSGSSSGGGGRRRPAAAAAAGHRVLRERPQRGGRASKVTRPAVPARTYSRPVLPAAGSSESGRRIDK
jgi:hypothetical protein